MNAALILSGGTGTRMGLDTPKQYIEVCGEPVIAYCMRSLFGHSGIGAVWIVAEAEWQEYILKCLEEIFRRGGEEKRRKWRGFAGPGATRQLSVWNGLEAMQGCVQPGDCVLIHDAARPLLGAEQISACLEAVREHDGALPVLPMKDTVYLSPDGRRVGGLLDRSEIYAGQAPEAFVFGKYREANRRLLPERILEINGSAEPAVLAGMDVAMIDGDERNFKITTRADLERFGRIVRESRGRNGR